MEALVLLGWTGGQSRLESYPWQDQDGWMDGGRILEESKNRIGVLCALGPDVRLHQMESTTLKAE